MATPDRLQNTVPVEACFTNNNGVCRLTGNPYCHSTDANSERCRDTWREESGMGPRQGDIEHPEKPPKPKSEE